MDLIVRRARCMDGRLVDIGIAGHTITALETKLAVHAPQEVDAEGCLAIPAFVNGQLHACKSFWRRLLRRCAPEVRSLPRFQAAQKVKALYSAGDIFGRVNKVMQLAVRHGTCAIRLFADVDEHAGLHAVEGLLRIRSVYAPFMTVQVVAFPQDGMRSDQTAGLMREALEMGVDVVGGIPWIEPTPAAQQSHVDLCFELAREFDRDLHFVCDDVADPAVRSLEMVARQTLAHNYQGRVSATQCAALAFYPDDYAAAVIDLLREAAITVFCNSHVSLIATEFDHRQQPWPRGITRVRQLLDAGVSVACAQDDIDNWFYAFGRNDMLEVAHFMAHMGQFAWSGEVDQVLPMVTTTAAQAIGVDHYGLRVGAEANLVVLEARDWHSALQFQAEKRVTVLRGHIAAQNRRDIKVNIP